MFCLLDMRISGGEVTRLACRVMARVPVRSPFSLFSHRESHLVPLPWVFQSFCIKEVSYSLLLHPPLFEKLMFCYHYFFVYFLK